MKIRTLKELDNMEIQLKKDWLETLNNMQSFFGNDVRKFEVKKDLIKLVSEIFENSFRLVDKERTKIIKLNEVVYEG